MHLIISSVEEEKIITRVQKSMDKFYERILLSELLEEGGGYLLLHCNLSVIMVPAFETLGKN